MDKKPRKKDQKFRMTPKMTVKVTPKKAKNDTQGARNDTQEAMYDTKNGESDTNNDTNNRGIILNILEVNIGNDCMKFNK